MNKSRKTWYLVLVGTVTLILVSILISLRPYGTPLNWLIRGAALMGYLAIFLSVVSSAYMRQMSRIFGRPFIKVHHTLTVTGLVLVTLHPLGAAIDAGSLSLFLPRFDSLVAFLEWGGRPAWYLIAAASLAAVLRKTIGRNWRTIHLLNYGAFLLVPSTPTCSARTFSTPSLRPYRSPWLLWSSSFSSRNADDDPFHSLMGETN